MLEFTIPGTLPTLNEIIKASKSHPIAYANMKKDYTALVMLHARKLPKLERTDVDITWYCKDMRKDKDNIAAGTKFILDGIVKAKIIKNDGWKQIGNINHHFEVDKDNPRIKVELHQI
ncbi:Holliday junction resolvase [Virgibacillus sp. Bac332]|uniref:Holliday junction resolvase n=1 Tax=Virgibacillus sp. Bac332 TaxID=2419842 RepID=UPI000EF508C8|nr:Holliday junction resolvase [Virgibacillus sp. Bac332]